MMTQSVFALDSAFSDVSSTHPNYNAITALKNKNIIGGYSDNTFKPENKINRAELTKIVVEAVYPGKAVGANCFPDVKEDWYAKYVCFAQAKGIINGYPDGKFYPNENINYVEALKIALEAFSYTPMVKTDVWYQAYLDISASLGIVVSTDNNEKISRGKMAQLIDNILGCLKTTKFSSKVGNFSITFPGKPINASTPFLTTTTGEISMYMYAYQTSDKVFLVAYSDMPDLVISSANAKDLLKAGEDSDLGGLTPDEEKENTYNGYTGLFYKVNKSDLGEYLVSQIYFVENRLYQIKMISTEGYPTDAEVDAFIGTFKLLK
jgi:hypothetical protein